MRQRYDEFNEGDLEAALSDWADDVVWQGSAASEFPGGGEHKGNDEAVKVLQEAVGASDEFKLTADEFFEDGDTVVVLGHTDVKKDDRPRRCRSCTSGAGRATRSSASRSSPTRCTAHRCSG